MKHANSVFEKVELRGKWWLPQQPEHQVEGNLVGSDAEGFRLTISGSFNPNESRRTYWPGNIPDDFPIIHGHTPAGDVTLYDTFCTRKTCTSLGLFELDFYVRTFVKGVLLASHNDLNFQTLRCKFSVLCEWVDAKAFDLDWETGLRKSTIKLKLPDRLKVYEGNGLVIYLEYAVRGPAVRIGQNNLTVEWEPQFVVESTAQELPWESPSQSNHSSVIYAIGQFLAVATLSPVYPFDIVGYSKQFEDRSSDKSGKTHKKAIELFREQRVGTPNYDSRKVLFPWKAIAKDPQKYFGNWFRFFAELRAPISLFIDSISRRNSYSPERFFNLMSALEGLHRFKFPTLSQPKGSHTEKVTSILDSVSAKHRSWLEEKLRYSHEPSLRRRLKDLTKPFEDLFGWFVGASGNSWRQREWRNKVTGAMADARNSIAHSLPEPKPDPGTCYYHFTRIGESLMSMWLMAEIGIDGKLVESRMKRNSFTTQYREELVEFLQARL